MVYYGILFFLMQGIEGSFSISLAILNLHGLEVTKGTFVV